MAIQVEGTEPILWCNHAAPSRRRPAFEWDEHGQRVPKVDPETGMRVFEKVPQRAHVGTPLTGMSQLNNQRWMAMLRHDGHEANILITNSAAHIVEASDGSSKRYMDRKARALGWLPVGTCPAAQLVSGQIGRGQLKSQESLDGKPCAHDSVGPNRPPCRHYKAEQEARRAAHEQRQVKLAEAAKSAAEKAIEAQTEIQQKTADSLVNAVSSIVGELAKKDGKAK